MKKLKVFVSYTLRDDAVNYSTLSLIDCYLKNSFNPFIDLLHNDSINKQQRIEEELNCSDIMFLVISNRIYDSPWVRKELEIAMNKKIPIQKLYIENFLPITC